MFWPQIIHTWMYGAIAFEEVIKKVEKAGADGIDLSIAWDDRPSNPRSLLRQDLQGMMSNAGLKAYASTALYFQPETDLSSNDKKTRDAAIDFSKQCIDVTAHAACDRMLVSPSWVSVSNKIYDSYEEDWKHAVDSIAQMAAYAATQGVTLMIEPINRYRVSLVHTVEEAIKMKEEIALPNVGIVPDIFHIMMEERQPFCRVLEAAGKDMKCLHVSDSGRTLPGMGNFNWQELFHCLTEIKFEGPLSHEPVMLYFSEKRMATDGNYAGTIETLFASGVKYLKKFMD